MIDTTKELVSTLQKILPTHYELVLTSNTKTPCISYQQRNNADAETGTTIGYSRIAYTIKVWGTNIGDITNYAIEIDKALRPLGYKRLAANELYDINSTMIQKILEYECLALETY